MRERRFHEGFDCYQQGLALVRDERFTVPALYHLGWAELQLLYLPEATHDILEGLSSAWHSKAAKVRWWLTPLQYARVALSRVQGAGVLALRQAEEVVRHTPPGAPKVLAFQALSLTQRLQGLYPQALASQERACQEALDGPAAVEAELALKLIGFLMGTVTPHDLRAELRRVQSSLAFRPLLHLAAHDLAHGRVDLAFRQLQEVVQADEPFILLDEAPLLPDLYAFGRERGLILPVPARSQSILLHLTVRGRPALHLNGELLPVQDSVAIGLLLFLALEGQATRRELASRLLCDTRNQQGNHEHAIRRAIGTLHDWVGYPFLVMEGQTLRLPADIQVTHNSADLHAGEVLPALYGHWIEQLRRANWPEVQS